MTTTDILKVRLYTYKSFRHYGGREIQSTAHICDAKFIKNQIDHTTVVELLEDCAGYKKGFLIAVGEHDIIS